MFSLKIWFEEQKAKITKRAELDKIKLKIKEYQN